MNTAGTGTGDKVSFFAENSKNTDMNLIMYLK